MSTPKPDRGTILVVDDDADIVRFVEMNLRLEGYRVVVARDGVEALAMVAAEMPDLVLLDTMMPGYDGIEVTRRLRADSRTSTLPIIMLTAKTMSADRVLGLTTGADDYIIKPFDTLELVARVRSTLRRNAEARAVSPLTSLPGNVRIEDEIAGRVSSGSPFAVAYLDLDNFKAFNDAHGFMRDYAVVSVSVGIATSERRRFDDYREVVLIATEMKGVAKGEVGSAIAVDRRAV